MKQATRHKTRNRKPKTRNREPLAEGPIPLDKRGRRRWSMLRDDQLVELAKKLIMEKNIQSREELIKADCGLYDALYKRKLLVRLEFSKFRRRWKQMADEDVLSHANRLIEKKGIRTRLDMQKENPTLYKELLERGLITKLNLKSRYRWRYVDDGEIISQAQQLVDDKGLTDRELFREDLSMYRVLRKRGLFSRIVFKERRNRHSMSDEELIRHAKELIKEKGITTRSQLDEEDHSLSQIICRRKLQDRIGLKRQMRKWSDVSDEEVIDICRQFIQEKGISTRKGLSDADYGLFKVVHKRNLLDAVGLKFDRRKMRLWRNLNDEQIAAYAQKVIDGGKVTGRSGLLRHDHPLYEELRKRKLLDSVFSSIEKTRSERAIEQIIDFTAGFGERG